MEKRTILAIILSMLVIMIWQLIFAPPPKKPLPEEEPIEKRVAKERKEEGRSEEIREALGEREGVLRDVVVETPLYRAVFTTGGARLRKWTLKEYKDRVETVVLWRRKEMESPKPVEMIGVEGSEDLPLATEVEIGESQYGEVLFEPDRTELVVEAGGEGAIVFRGRLRDGLAIIKRYRFYGDEYRVDLNVELINGGTTPVNPETTLTWCGLVGRSGRYTFAGPSVLAGNAVERLKVKEIRKGMRFTNDVKWMADEENYFVSLIAPQNIGNVRVEVRERQGAETAEGVGFENRMTFSGKGVAPGEKVGSSFLIYVGPKLPELLKTLNVEAEKAVNFGKYLGSIEKILLRFLEFAYDMTGNYGVAIIILSVVLKVIFWPLSRKSYRSMQEMQRVQPEMKMLQEKYKDDRQRLNQEMMALYKRRKVNPVGGCLPMLIQFPFLIALYKALPLSFNLRHAPFVLWIQDLSAADTFFVDQLALPLLGNTPVGPLPLLMGVSMLIQQKMSPTMGDPRQARMMMIMPIMFIFIFLSFPSGLVLYWFVQNLLSIGEQYLTRRGAR
jgi:YidC/Oxa1 family membrane protein insertase